MCYLWVPSKNVIKQACCSIDSRAKLHVRYIERGIELILLIQAQHELVPAVTYNINVAKKNAIEHHKQAAGCSPTICFL